MNFPLISFEGYDVNESASTLKPLIFLYILRKIGGKMMTIKNNDNFM
jgi:hypothetical protein